MIALIAVQAGFTILAFAAGAYFGGRHFATVTASYIFRNLYMHDKALFLKVCSVLSVDLGQDYRGEA